jgi:hypothetical protein
VSQNTDWSTRELLRRRKSNAAKAIKEAKNKGLKIRGTGSSIAKHKANRAAGNKESHI